MRASKDQLMNRDLREFAKQTGSILIVDDNEKIRNMLHGYFESEGFDVAAVASGSEMHRTMAVQSVDLILLDIGLPGEDGLALARELRSKSGVGIIMLTGRSDLVDRIVGIEVGADDYIGKPFHLREVLARVKAVLRRVRGNEATGRPTEEGMSGPGVSFGQWQLYLDRRCLIDGDGTEIVLTSGEFDMLAALVRHPGRVLSRDQLMDLTRGRSWAAEDRTIDAQISRLRKKIELDPKRPAIIKSVRGVGYVFAAKVKPISG